MKKKIKGEFTVEFHKVLAEIRQKYDSGIIVGKIIYDDLYNAKKITMSYNRFAYYFRKEITCKTDATPKKEIHKQDDPKESEPKWLKVGAKNSPQFNPNVAAPNPADEI